MKGIPRRSAFIVCVAAALLIQRFEEPWWFGVAVLVAFTNLFSSQFACALDGCRSQKGGRAWLQPARVAAVVNRTTSAAGAILLLYALLHLYR